MDIFINNQHEYNYKKDSTDEEINHTLSYSENGNWPEDAQGDLAVMVTERDMDVFISFGRAFPLNELLENQNRSKHITLNLSEVEQLEIILRMISREQEMKRIIEVANREKL